VEEITSPYLTQMLLQDNSWKLRYNLKMTLMELCLKNSWVHGRNMRDRAQAKIIMICPLITLVKVDFERREHMV
jgi:hypothetical protein